MKIKNKNLYYITSFLNDAQVAGCSGGHLQEVQKLKSFKVFMEFLRYLKGLHRGEIEVPRNWGKYDS